MGYYSRFTLEISGIDRSKEIQEYVKEHENDDWAYNMIYALGEDLYDDGDNCKWYSMDEDMIKISIVFPDVIFDIFREGEENGDISHVYFKNGKTQICEANIIFDKYDENKLK